MSKFVKNKPRLGRGLSSLISVSELPVERELPEVGGETPLHGDGQAPANPPPVQAGDGSAIHLAVDAIVPNPHQPRRKMDEALIAELAASLRVTGLIQPIVVRKQGDQYQLIAGERRLRAAKL